MMNRTAKMMNKRGMALLLALLLMLPLAAGAQGLSQPASVSGCAYVDSNQNYLCDEGEQLMSGLTVRLFSLTDGIWSETASIETDEYGQYRFLISRSGEYCVRSSTTAADFVVAAVGNSPVRAEGGVDMRSETFTVASGEKVTLDVGLWQSASLSFLVFEDENRDGKVGTYDEGVKGVLVEVLDGETVLASGETPKKGTVNLGGIHPGSYTIRVTLPEGYGFAKKGEETGSKYSCMEAAGTRVATSEAFAFTSGGTTEAAVGVMTVGSFSGRVFEDVDNDGIMAETDPGVSNVALRLEGKKTGLVYELASSEDGTFCFDFLPADTYSFSAQLPEGMMYARYSKDGGDLRSVFTGETVVREFQVSSKKPQKDKNVGLIENGVISGSAFFDTNYNGVWDEGEAGYPGVTVYAVKVSNGETMGKAVTDENGVFAIEALRSSKYRLRAILPDDGSEFTVVPEAGGDNANMFPQNKQSRECTVEVQELTSGQVVTATIGVAKGASVEGVIFEDANYDGKKTGKERTFSGVLVKLVDEDGNVAAQTRSVTKGVYELDGIMPGTYTLMVERTKNYGFTRLRPLEEGGSYIRELIDGYGVSDPIEISMAQELTQVNAGMLPAGTVSGVFFHDANDNGLMDDGEGGMTTATVRLLSADGEIDLVRSVDANGNYLFDGVMPGDYTMTFQLPEHAEIAQVVSGGNTLENAGRETTTASFGVAMGDDVTYSLVGGVTLGSFEGIAFHDANANGQQDAGEEALSGVTVTLTGAKGSEQQTVSAGDGKFSIIALRPDEYQLTLTMPDGYISSSDTAGLTLAPKAQQTLSCPWTVLTDRQQLLIGAVQPAAVSGEIRLDENNNGQSETDERMMTGITLELVDDATGLVAQTIVTNEEGFLFDSVCPGAYTLRFQVPEQAEPAQIVGSTFRLNGTAMEESGIVVAEAQQSSDHATALVSRTTIAGSLSLYDLAGQQPVAGVALQLLDANTRAEVASCVSDETGAYRFDGLWPGEYLIHADFAPDAIFVRPGDSNYPQNASTIQTDDGYSDVITLKMAQHQLSHNVLYIRTAKIGDLAWVDENGNGLLDGSERRLPGVKVQLLMDGQVAYETTTDLHGYYLFDSVYPGRYTLQAVAYPELTITKPVPALRIISSCLVSGDGTGAQSDPFTVESGSTSFDFDLGFLLLPGQQMPSLPEEPTKDWSAWNAQYTSMQE